MENETKKNGWVKPIIWLVVVVLVVWGGYSLFNKKIPTETGPIKIGVVVSQTGVGAYVGEQVLRGLNLAKDVINSVGGINGRKIELVIEDSKTEAATSLSATEKLISVDKIKIIIGDSWNSTTAVMVPVTNKNKVILISPVASLDSLSSDDYFFRTIPLTKDLLVPLADYVSKKMGIKKVAILRQETPFGIEHANDFKKRFEENGGKIVSEESFDLKATDVRSQITKVRAFNPEAIFNLHATGPSIGMLIKQAEELNIKVKWLGAYGSENSALVKEYGIYVDGLIYPYPYDINSSNTGVQEFARIYREKYNQEPELFAANAFDALNVIVYAIRKAGDENDTDKIRSALLSLENFDGASGTLSFDKNGDVKKPIIIKQIKDGQFVKLEE